MNDPKPEPAKRFYNTVEVTAREGSFTVTLDGRELRTPLKRSMALNEALAKSLAREWDAQTDVILPLTMPLTRLVNTAIDGVADAKDDVRSAIAAFAAHDLILYRADHPRGLVDRQAELWDPVVAKMSERFGLPLSPTAGIMPVAQDPGWPAAVAAALPDDPLSLAAFHQLTTITGSVFLSLSHHAGDIDFDALMDAAHVDEDWNIAEWGADDEAMARRALRREDASASSKVLRP